MVKTNNMKHYQLGLYEKAMPPNLTWKEKLVEAKRAGFDYIEMSIDETDEKMDRLDMPKDKRKELLDIMWEVDIRILSICLSAHRRFPLGHLKKEIQLKSLDIIEKAINLASDLGVRMIQLAGYDVYYAKGSIQTQRNFERNLKIAVAKAARKGVLLGFETMETSFMNTVKKSMVYVSKIQSPFLGVYPDIGNLKNASLLYNSSVEDDLKVGKGHLIAAHLKETLPECFREIPFGEGHSEYENNIRALKKLGVFMFVGEFWYLGSQTWKSDLHEANHFLRKRLDEVFLMI